MKRETKIRPITPAKIPLLIESLPRVAPIWDCWIKLRGKGKAPAFYWTDNSLADLVSKLPLITALPSGIIVWTVGGAVIG